MGCHECRYHRPELSNQCARLHQRNGPVLRPLRHVAPLGGFYLTGRNMAMLAHMTEGLITPSCFVEVHYV